MKVFKRIFKAGVFSTLLVVMLIIFCDKHITSFDSFCTSNINEVEQHEVGLLLGTSKYTSLNQMNLFYKYRLESAVQLYKEGKICKILVSGDNGPMSYNEPQMFYRDLIKLGVHPKDIFLDYAGFRTLDSVIRAKEVFDQKEFLVISQDFHNQRALFIARNQGINAQGFNANSVDFSFSPKTFIREKLARVKAILDVYILGKQPKFLGEKITIS